MDLFFLVVDLGIQQHSISTGLFPWMVFYVCVISSRPGLLHEGNGARILRCGAILIFMLSSGMLFQALDMSELAYLV